MSSLNNIIPTCIREYDDALLLTNLIQDNNSDGGGYIEIEHYIERGTNGLSVCCFVSGIVCCIISLLSIINIFNIPLHPFYYILNIFILLMSIVTILIEATPDMLKKKNHKHHHQIILFNNIKILTYLYARGIYYIFIGLLCIIESGLLYIIIGIIGMYYWYNMFNNSIKRR